MCRSHQYAALKVNWRSARPATKCVRRTAHHAQRTRVVRIVQARAACACSLRCQFIVQHKLFATRTHTRTQMLCIFLNVCHIPRAVKAQSSHLTHNNAPHTCGRPTRSGFSAQINHLARCPSLARVMCVCLCVCVLSVCLSGLMGHR